MLPRLIIEGNVGALRQELLKDDKQVNKLDHTKLSLLQRAVDARDHSACLVVSLLLSGADATGQMKDSHYTFTRQAHLQGKMLVKASLCAFGATDYLPIDEYPSESKEVETKHGENTTACFNKSINRSEVFASLLYYAILHHTDDQIITLISKVNDYLPSLEKPIYIKKLTGALALAIQKDKMKAAEVLLKMDIPVIQCSLPLESFPLYQCYIKNDRSLFNRLKIKVKKKETAWIEEQGSKYPAKYSDFCAWYDESTSSVSDQKKVEEKNQNNTDNAIAGFISAINQFDFVKINELLPELKKSNNLDAVLDTLIEKKQLSPFALYLLEISEFNLHEYVDKLVVKENSVFLLKLMAAGYSLTSYIFYAAIYRNPDGSKNLHPVLLNVDPNQEIVKQAFLNALDLGCSFNGEAFLRKFLLTSQKALTELEDKLFCHLMISKKSYPQKQKRRENNVVTIFRSMKGRLLATSEDKSVKQWFDAPRVKQTIGDMLGSKLAYSVLPLLNSGFALAAKMRQLTTLKLPSDIEKLLADNNKRIEALITLKTEIAPHLVRRKMTFFEYMQLSNTAFLAGGIVGVVLGTFLLYYTMLLFAASAPPLIMLFGTAVLFASMSGLAGLCGLISTGLAYVVEKIRDTIPIAPVPTVSVEDYRQVRSLQLDQAVRPSDDYSQLDGVLTTRISELTQENTNIKNNAMKKQQEAQEKKIDKKDVSVDDSLNRKESKKHNTEDAYSLGSSSTTSSSSMFSASPSSNAVDQRNNAVNNVSPREPVNR